MRERLRILVSASISMKETMRGKQLQFFSFVWKRCLFGIWAVALLLIVACFDHSTIPVDDGTDVEPVGSIPEEVNPDVSIAIHGTKISQLVGDYDRELSEPTNNMTYTRYDLEAADLGVPFQHGDRTYILFGDTWGIIGGDRDAYAYTNDTDPEDGLDLTFVTDENNTYYPLTIPEISQAAFEVPMEGISANGTMYVYQTTDHSAQVTMGRSIVARADDPEEKTFTKLYDFSTQKFINLSIVKVNSADWDLLPENSGEGLVILGSGSYRNSQIYLAFQPASEIENYSRIRYFGGIDKNGKPLWEMGEADALPIFTLANPCIGELSVSYNQFIKRWILLYNCDDPRGINLRTAKYPWGPWTKSQILFDPWNDGGYCHFMHAGYESQQCDQVQDPGRDNVWGGEYGPYQFENFATGDDQSTTIYFTMSTWNPYTVVLMKAKLEIERTDSNNGSLSQRFSNPKRTIDGFGSYRVKGILSNLDVPYRSSAILENTNTGQSSIYHLNATLPDKSLVVDIQPGYITREKNGIRKRNYYDSEDGETDKLSTYKHFDYYRKINDAEWDLKPFQVFGGNLDGILNLSSSLRYKSFCIEGLEIDDIEDNAIAGELGVKDGDVIVEVNSVPINSFYRYLKAWYNVRNSDEVILKIHRKNLYITLKYNLAWGGGADGSVSDHCCPN